MKNNLQPKSGFDRAVLSDGSDGNATRNKDSNDSVNEDLERKFLVSIGGQGTKYSDTPKSVELEQAIPKRTRNRKRVCHNKIFCFKGSEYQVNVRPSGIYVETMRSMLNQFEIGIEKWKRVFVYRFDLHTLDRTSDNQIISDFRKKLVERIKWNYQVNELGYAWVREQEKAKSQHYHFVLFLDGDRIRHPAKLKMMIKDLWETKYVNHHVPVIPKPYLFVDNEDDKKQAVYRFSYLAKARGKGYRPPQTKDYSCSRMTL